MQVKVKDVIKIMESYFPPRLAEDWDNVGLQIGSYGMPVHRVMVCLDLDERILSQAIEQKVDLIITHHPLFFKGIKTIRFDQAQGRLIQSIIKSDICVYSAHTNLDSAERGLNQVLAEKLGLQDIKPLNKNQVDTLYKLVVYVPAGHEEAVRQAIHEAGAGAIGRYSDCSFRTRGIGTFKPGAGTNPYIGTKDQLEEVEEYRLETVVPQDQLNQVLKSIKRAHPYEEPAYDVFALQNEGQIFSLGRTGRLAEASSLADLCTSVKKSLELDSLRVVGDLNRQIRKVAVVSGAGTSFMGTARAKECDVLITGDLKYHEARDAEAMGIAIIDAGHHGTERIVSAYLANLLEEAFRDKDYEATVSIVLDQDCIRTI